MTSGGHNRKVTAEQRGELLRVYLAGDEIASAKLSEEYGVGPKYAANLASERGHRPLHKPTPTNRKRLPVPLNSNRWFWTDEKRKALSDLAATGMIAADIGAAIGATQASVITFAGRHGISVVKYSPEQQAVYDGRARAREELRNARKVAASHQKKVSERATAMERASFTPLAVQAATSKTSRAYRLALPPIGEMTKSQLRAMLTQAVRNTAEASV